MISFLAFALGYVLDLLFGDPHSSPFPHPVVLMGRGISLLEKGLRKVFPKTNRGELVAGVFLAVLVPCISMGLVYTVLWLLQKIHPLLRLAVEAFWCYQILAIKSLRDESMAVYHELQKGDVAAARKAVSMIVGRDTASLDEEGIAKAAVETVAENNSDGAVAPMLFLALGGAPWGMLYKAINTLDSMVGYKNSVYLYFGRASAYLDDIANFLPARIAALLMVLAAPLCRMDGKAAHRVLRRDRKNHSSPNSAHTEAACAGALGVQLGGPTTYRGVTLDKPTIGDATRPIEAEDIKRANRLHYTTSLLAFVLFAGLRLAVVLCLRYVFGKAVFPC